MANKTEEIKVGDRIKIKFVNYTTKTEYRVVHVNRDGDMVIVELGPKNIMNVSDYAKIPGWRGTTESEIGLIPWKRYWSVGSNRCIKVKKCNFVVDNE